MPPPKVEDQDSLLLSSPLSRPWGQARPRLGSLTIRSTCQAGDLAGVSGGLTLGVIEVGGRRDNRVGNVLEVGPGVALRHQSADSARCISAVNSYGPVAAHVSLSDRAHGAMDWSPPRFLAGWPISTSPLRANATIDG